MSSPQLRNIRCNVKENKPQNVISVQVLFMSLYILTCDYQEQHTEDYVMIGKECAYVALCV